MPNSTTETRTFVGQTGTHAFDGFAGFRIGQPYRLTYTEAGGQVEVQLPHAEGRTMVMSAEQFATWFRKA